MMRFGESAGEKDPAPSLGGGATCHVFLEPVLRFSASATCVCYDDAARVLLTVDGDAVHITPIDSRLSPAATAAPRLLRLDSSAPVSLCRLSLDGRLLALQRSPVEVAFVNTTTGNAFNYACRQGSAILGLFWTQSAGGCEFVLATTNGLELFSILPGGAGLRLLDEKRKPGCLWMVYTHETRVCLLGYGPSGNKLFGFQFSSSTGAGASPLKLPKAELPAPSPGWPPIGPNSVRCAASALEHTTSRARHSLSTQRPVVSIEPRGAMESRLAHAPSPPLPLPSLSALALAQLKLLAMYGRLFCTQIDEQGSSLVLYRFYRDALLRRELWARHCLFLSRPGGALSFVSPLCVF